MNIFKFTALLLVFALIPVRIWGQTDSTLRDLADIVESLRKCSRLEDYGYAISRMYNVGGGELITLLDDIKSDESAEYHGTDMNKFRLNSVVDSVARMHSGINLSKSNYYDSRQKGVYYSLIEKSIKAGLESDLTITEHKGHQEIVVLPYDMKAQVTIDVKCDNRDIDKITTESGRHIFSIDYVTVDDEIHVYILNNSATFKSFAILNYNSKDNKDSKE